MKIFCILILDSLRELTVLIPLAVAIALMRVTYVTLRLSLTPLAGIFLLQGGLFYITFMDTFAAGTSLILVVFFEAVAVAWVYGKSHVLLTALDFI